ncbi:hypothetical protein C1X29_07980 [Pseudomonas sp. GW456-12-10-14-LB2]|nr:hypothetical protein C1X29_07980 [Pseudomonas sp. GW456-12-10-14-LB2]
MGASLLAIAVGHSTSMLTERTPSRASALPQCFWCSEDLRYRPTTSSACNPFCPSTTAYSTC